MTGSLRAALGLILLTLLQFIVAPVVCAVPGQSVTGWGAPIHLTSPRGIARDTGGNLYVTSMNETQVRDLSRVVQVFDSTGKRLHKWNTRGSGDGEFSNAGGIAVGPDGNLYIADVSNNRVQVFDKSGNFLRKWGGAGSGYGEFNTPLSLAVDASGQVFVCDSYNQRIQVFDSTGRFVRAWGNAGSGDGDFSYPAAVAVDAGGSVYVADTGNARIQVFDNSGTFLRKWGSSGRGNGQFQSPSGLAVDGGGHLLVSDYYRGDVQVFDRSGTFVTKWGSGYLHTPTALTVESNGDVYVTGESGEITIFTSAGDFVTSWGSGGSGDGQFSGPMGPAVDADGNVYVADSNNQRIEVFTSTGTFVRKWGEAGMYGNYYFGVAVGSTGNVYAVSPYSHSDVNVFDKYGNSLRRWSAGTLFEAVGIAVAPKDRVYVASGAIQQFDQYGTELAFWWMPLVSMVTHLATDYNGNVYASDQDKGLVVVFDSNGNLVKTIGDGYFTAAQPGPIAVDGNGNVLVADASDHILVFDSAGALRATWGGTGDDPGLFNYISGIAVDKTNTRIYVTDYNNNRVQVLEGFGTAVPTGWSTSNVGSVGVTGGAGFLYGTFTLSGSGADIWGTADGFRFVYQTLSGDGQIVARVASLANTHGYAKAGVMIRESLAANSKHAMVDITPSYGAEFSRRASTGSSTSVAGLGGVAAPYWVKLVRSGNTFSAYVSSDGITWRSLGSDVITMAGSVYVGLVDCSHVNTVLNTAAIDNVSVGRPVAPPTVAITSPTDGAVYSAPASIPITATAAAGTGASVKQVDFFAQGSLIGTAATAPYTVDWSNVPAGDYTLTARVTDTSGATATSAPVKISVVSSPLPSPWLTSDVGSVGLAGSAAFASGVFTVKGAGADIWGSADSFRYVYQTLTGDGQIVARVTSLANTHGYAKSAVMFRQSLDAGSVHAMMDLTPSYGAEFSRRTSAGGATTVSGLGGVAAPYWVKLVRSGNTFSGYVAASGGTWRLVGTSTVPMGSSVLVGLAVCSHNTQALTTSTVDNVTVVPGSVVSPTATITSPAAGSTYAPPATIPITATAMPGTGASVKQVAFYAGSTLIGTAVASPYSVTWSNVPGGSYSLTAVVTDTLGNSATSPAVAVTVSSLPSGWLTQDVGSVGLAGSAAFAGGVFTLKGAGADIWGTADAFRFVYKPMTGDGQIIARVSSLTNTNGYAKGGVMIRETLTAGSKHAMVDLTPSYGAEFSRRTSTGGSTDVTGRGGIAAPYWVRLVRSGSTFSGYVSTNGTTWTLVGTSTIAMNSTVYVGLVMTSHNNYVVGTATIDGVQ